MLGSILQCVNCCPCCSSLSSSVCRTFWTWIEIAEMIFLLIFLEFWELILSWLTCIVLIWSWRCRDCVLIIRLNSSDGAFHKNFIAFLSCELKWADGAHEMCCLIAGGVDSLCLTIKDVTAGCNVDVRRGWVSEWKCQNGSKASLRSYLMSRWMWWLDVELHSATRWPESSVD